MAILPAPVSVQVGQTPRQLKVRTVARTGIVAGTRTKVESSSTLYVRDEINVTTSGKEKNQQVPGRFKVSSGTALSEIMPGWYSHVNGSAQVVPRMARALPRILQVGAPSEAAQRVYNGRPAWAGACPHDSDGGFTCTMRHAGCLSPPRAQGQKCCIPVGRVQTAAD